MQAITVTQFRRLLQKNLLNEVTWITKDGRHIPIYGKGEIKYPANISKKGQDRIQNAVNKLQTENTILFSKGPLMIEGKEVVAYYNPNNKSITLNNNLFSGDLDKVDTYFDKAVKQNFYHQTKDPVTYILAHEDTHSKVPTNVMGMLRDKKQQKAWETYVLGVGGEKGILKEIGVYATESPKELFAEARAMKLSGSTISTGIAKLLRNTGLDK